jgi:hypothetical protein
MAPNENLYLAKEPQSDEPVEGRIQMDRLKEGFVRYFGKSEPNCSEELPARASVKRESGF